MPQDRPVKPDEAFSLRYEQAGQYGFFMHDKSKDTSWGDIITNDERYVPLIMNPQQLTMREPFATAVTPTQGGGVVVESRGGVLKMCSISGTTAWVPNNRDDDVDTAPNESILKGRQKSLVPEGSAGVVYNKTLAKRSGFLAFHKLRHLFRLYQYERSRGNLNVTFHWFDTKDEDMWRIEPQDFTMRRQARKPHLYDYDISFQVIEESSKYVFDITFIRVNGVLLPKPPKKVLQNRDLISRISGAIQSATDSVHAYSMPSVVQSIGRLRDISGAAAGFVNKLSGAVQRTFQNLLKDINNVVGFFDDIHSAFTTALATPLALLNQLSASVDGARAVWFELAPDHIQEELNEFCVEAKQLAVGLVSYHLAAFNQAPGQDVLSTNEQYATGRGKGGFTTDLMQELPTSGGPLDSNPLLGASGLDMVTDVSKLATVKSLVSVPIQVGDTVYSIAQRELGDIRRAVDIILINGLDAPYIVDDPYDKPNNTLAWGEFISLPSSEAPTSGVEAQLISQLVPSFTSTGATDVDTLTLTDNSVTDWQIDQWVGYTVILTHASTGVQEERVIVANTETGEITFNYAFDNPAAVNDVFSIVLKTFVYARPESPDVKAYGRDLLLRFDSNNKATIVMNAKRDAAMVSGQDNMIQALRIRALTEVGGLPWHRGYGMTWPIGERWNPTRMQSFVYFAKKSMLNDTRITLIRNVQIGLDSNKFFFSAEVQPVQSRKTRNISVIK